MESPKLTISPNTRKIIITLYDNPVIVRENDPHFYFPLPAPERVIMIIPVELPEDVISISIGVDDSSEQ